LAQEEQRFQLDIHAGLAGSQVAGDGLAGFNKLNIMGGLGLQTEISDNFNLGFELNFAQKGSKLQTDASDPSQRTTQYKMSLSYVQVPVYLRYKYNDKLGLLAGPAIGVLVANKEEDFNGEINSDPAFNTLDFSLILGLYYNLSERLRAGARFDQSILPIRTKGEGLSPRLVGRQYNTVIGLYVYLSI
jgi:opacity protein-like surface antigen